MSEVPLFSHSRGIPRKWRVQEDRGDSAIDKGMPAFAREVTQGLAYQTPPLRRTLP